MGMYDVFSMYYRVTMILVIFSLVWAVIANWKLFTVAGEVGWKCLIPVYGGFVKHKITFGEQNKWLYFVGWVSLFIIPILIFPMLGLLGVHLVWQFSDFFS